MDRNKLIAMLAGEPTAAFGTGSPTEEAQKPSGLAALFGGAYNALGDLSKRAIGNSQTAMETGYYNPAPVLDAAMLPMGTGGIAGVPVKGAEAVLGAGFVGRKLPRDNYNGPVSRYTDELFREMSPSEALVDLPTSVAHGGYGRGGNRRFYADQPDLALGQGGNRGVRVTYDAAPFEGTINKKPGWENLFPSGSAEYVAAPTPGANIRDAVRGFEIDQTALSKVEAAQYHRLLANLEQQGWGVTRAPDKITVKKP
jgi:hypothetical protein